jgi:hypothetical protein
LSFGIAANPRFGAIKASAAQGQSPGNIERGTIRAALLRF